MILKMAVAVLGVTVSVRANCRIFWLGSNFAGSYSVRLCSMQWSDETQ